MIYFKSAPYKPFRTFRGDTSVNHFIGYSCFYDVGFVISLNASMNCCLMLDNDTCFYIGRFTLKIFYTSNHMILYS